MSFFLGIAARMLSASDSVTFVMLTLTFYWQDLNDMDGVSLNNSGTANT